MAEINGVQWARIWAKAWRDPQFRKTLEANPLDAATQFKAECDAKGYTAFPDPAHTSLLNLEEYARGSVVLKGRPKDELDNIIRGRSVQGMTQWVKSEWLSPEKVRQALLGGSLEVY